MQRNINLVRDLLLDARDSKGKAVPGASYSLDEIAHLGLLLDGKLIKPAAMFGEQMLPPISLTWEGHELITAIGDNEVWSLLIEKIGLDKLSTVPLSVLKEICEDLIYAKTFDSIHPAKDAG